MPNSYVKGEEQTRHGKVRFGDFEADLLSGELRKSGTRIKLQDQPFKVLQVLLERPGELITREELRSRIWPEDSFGDFDHAVNVAVGKLRTALGDSADDPCFIETVPRRGYRFVAPIEEDVIEAASGLASVIPIAPPHTKAERKTATRFFAALVIAGVILGAGVWVGRSTLRTKPLDFQRLTVRRGTIYGARFAPDGHVLYAASWEGAPLEVFSTDVKFSGVRSLELSGTQLLAISPSGEMAVLQSATPRFMLTVHGTLSKVPLTGGSPRQIAENIEWADWSPDGKSMAVVRDMGGRQRLEYPLGHVLYETIGWISHIRISPKGDLIAFLDHPTYDDDRGVVSVVDLAGQKKDLSTGWESEEGLAWSPDGKHIWFSATHAGLERRLYAVDLDGKTELKYRAPGGVTLQDIAPDGRVLLTRDDQHARIMGLAPGATKERDLSWLDWSLPVDLSHDGKTLLFDEQGEQAGSTYAVAMRSMDGSAPVSLGEGMSGDFSPDGKWAASIVSYKQLVLLPTGAGTPRRIDASDIQQYEHAVHWFPDGKEILFTGNVAGHGVRCFVQSIDGGKPRPITPEGVSYCRVSPDGRVVAATDTSDKEIRLYPIDGGASRAMVGVMPGESFEWTSDPRFIYVNDLHASPMKIYRVNLQTGERKLFKEVTPFDATGLCGMSHIIFSHSGDAYVYSYTQILSELYLVQGLK